MTTSAELQAFHRRMIEGGIRAPSGDNCQPWFFRFTTSEQLLIHILPERARSFFDFQHGPTFLSVGAVIENIRTLAASCHLNTNLDYLGGVGDQPAARLTFYPDSKSAVPVSVVNALFARTVNRRPFFPWPISATKLQRLRANPVPGTAVRVLHTRKEVRRWARLIYVGDLIRLSHPVLHAELYSKFLFPEDVVNGRRVGLEVNRLGLGPGGQGLLRFLRPWSRVQRLSRWGLARLFAGQARFLALTSSALVAVSIPQSTPADWMRAGEQVQRLWVGAHEQGLAVHPMTVAFFLDQRYQEEGMVNFCLHQEADLQELRRRLSNEALEGQGAMLFRLGYAWPMKGTAIRMPIEAFVNEKGVVSAGH